MTKSAHVFFLSSLAVTLGLVGCGEGSGALPATGDLDGGGGGSTGGGGATGGGGSAVGGSSATAGSTGSAGRGGTSGGGTTGTAGSGGTAGSAGRGGTGGIASGGTGGTAAGGAGGLAAGGRGGAAGGAGGAPAGGRGGAAGGAGGSGAGGAGACNIPSCISDLTKDCTPMGACMQQTVGTETRQCYANGYKQVNSISLQPPGFLITAYKPPGTAVCYTATAPLAAGGSLMLTYRNPAGVQVATATIQANTFTVTCTGQAPVVIDVNSCGAQNPNPMMMMGMNMCTAGVCM